MSLLLLNTCLFWLFLTAVMCQRRVTGRERVEVDKNYVVYILGSPQNEPEVLAVGWLCGGAIIHPYFILTSNSCLTYKQKKWVVAGYNKYIGPEKLHSDLCARYSRKKIVYHCSHEKAVPSTGNISETKYIPISKWRQIDIGLGKVAEPYDFQDKGYLVHCSYIPNAIKMSFAAEGYTPGVDALVYGWGSERYYKPEDYHINNNSPYLMGVTTTIMDKKKCKEIYNNSAPTEKIDVIVDKYTICGDGTGKVDIDGFYFGPTRRLNSDSSIEFENLYAYLPDQTLKNGTINYHSISGNKVIHSTRRNGPCQNDHGGPLVTWIGGHEYLVGVSSGFLVNENMECVGPYLYTSVACASKLINCMLSQAPVSRRYYGCENDDDYRVRSEHTNWEELENIGKTSTPPHDYWMYSD